MDAATIRAVPKRQAEFGEFREAGLVIERWLEAHPSEDRKSIAQKVGVTPAAVGHWINGKSWPRSQDYRARLSRMGVDVTAIDQAVCKAYGLDPLSADEKAAIARMRADQAVRETDRIRKGRK